MSLAAPHRRPLQLRALLAAGALVLLAHALLLGGLPVAPGPGWRAEAPRPMQVRQLPATAVAPAVPVPPAMPEPAARAEPVTRPAAQRPAPLAAPAAAPAPAADISTPFEEPPAPPPARAEPGGTSLPLYATQLPPAATLQYSLQRGRASGVAQLEWRPAAGRYQLQMSGLLLGARFIGWASQGRVDAHGVAPERYVESHRGREVRAVNFQRESGRITFSGPQLEYPLVPGAQDRLSWMLQLAAVMAANPALAAKDSPVQLFVAGPRGDAEVWTFTVQGLDTVQLPGGALTGALHLLRQPQRPYDTLVDVWLDPARHHLPVRVRLRTVGTGGDGVDFVLAQMALP